MTVMGSLPIPSLWLSVWMFVFRKALIGYLEFFGDERVVVILIELANTLVHVYNLNCMRYLFLG